MKYVHTLLLLSVLLLSEVYTNYPLFVYVLLAISLFQLLQKIGNGIALREMIAFYSCIIYLLMPLLGYQFYTYGNAMARLWVKYMPIDEVSYFRFVLPAMIVFMIGLFLPVFSSKPEPDEHGPLTAILNKAKPILKDNVPWIPLLILGLFGYFFRYVITISAVAYFMNTFYLLLFSAFLCIYFSPKFKYKGLLIGFISLLIFYEAIQTGMFTVLVYMGIVIASIIFVGKKIPFWRKLLITAVAVMFVIILQSTKGAFRKETWNSAYEGSKTGLFVDMMKKNLTNFDALFDSKAFFPLYVRMNQGYVTSLVIRRIPAVQDYDHGKSIYLTVASSLLPRVIWNDKLESGGGYNMKHFAGWTLKGWATNIGPVGEAYGNFGITGGIIYMLFFGLFIRLAYFTVLRISVRYPLLIFWIPVMFYELSYSMENDTLQALNAVIKGAVFVWLAYKIAPSLFIARKKNNRNKANENSHHLRDNRPGWSLPG